MQFVDKAFARRLESCEEMPQVMYARLFQKTRPEMGAAEEEVCGGHMVFAGLGSPIGRATGVGLDRLFTAADLDRVESFYRAHQAPAQVDLCSMHEPAVFELFKERGYAIAELNNVLYRKLDTEEKFPPPPPECEIRRSLPEEADVAGNIVETAFFPEGAPEPFRGLIAPFYQMERGLAFVATVEGKMVACGTGQVIPEYRVFALCGAGTLAEFRGRPADGITARPHASRRRGRVRICHSRHPRRNHLAAQRRASRLPRGLQQGHGDQALRQPLRLDRLKKDSTAKTGSVRLVCHVLQSVPD